RFRRHHLDRSGIASTRSPHPRLLTRLLKQALAARGPDGQRPSAAARRVALLRMVCSQLPLADVLPSARPDGGRWQIAWVMDLLGVFAADAAIDILMHDTSGLPAALGVAMRQLFDGDERLRELTADSLARWRTDLRRIMDFRAQVMAELTDEPEVASVLYAALLLYSAYGMEDFDASQIEEMINALVDPANISEAGVRLFPDLPRVLEHAVSTRLLTSEGGSFSLLPGGLPRLLTGDTAATESAARKAVQELTDQRARLADRLMLRAVQEAIDHLETNSFMAFRSMVTSLEDYRHTLPDELGDLVTEVISQFRQFDTYHQVAIDDAKEQVTKPDRFDVAVLLVEIAQKRETRHLRIVVEEREPQSHPVVASRLLVSMAIDNLLSNARRAIMEADAAGGTVLLRVGASNGNTIIDVEDSGPGLPDEVREQILRGEPASLRPGGGRGLPDAKTLLGYYGGTVQAMPEASSLGGAYFRISLPSASTDHSPHS
ncbi:ATP-binding protein, partial [Nonomuraea sp. NPDC005650]|uniref:sensor histidine kinase n=1 Tax=Nonomuraea sp. NPDC005650 TaxID=3157045 RepID=UPI0033B2DDF2